MLSFVFFSRNMYRHWIPCARHFWTLTAIFFGLDLSFATIDTSFIGVGLHFAVVGTDTFIFLSAHLRFSIDFFAFNSLWSGSTSEELGQLGVQSFNGKQNSEFALGFTNFALLILNHAMDCFHTALCHAFCEEIPRWWEIVQRDKGDATYRLWDGSK